MVCDAIIEPQKDAENCHPPLIADDDDDKATVPLPPAVPVAANRRQGGEKKDELAIDIADLDSSDDRKSRQGCSNTDIIIRRLTHHKSLVNNVVRDIFCPITMDMMTEPMLTPQGISFEKQTLIKWLRHIRRCPVTSAHLNEHELTPNTELQRFIDWIQGLENNERSFAPQDPIVDMRGWLEEMKTTALIMRRQEGDDSKDETKNVALNSVVQSMLELLMDSDFYEADLYEIKRCILIQLSSTENLQHDDCVAESPHIKVRVRNDDIDMKAGGGRIGLQSNHGNAAEACRRGVGDRQICHRFPGTLVCIAVFLCSPLLLLIGALEAFSPHHLCVHHDDAAIVALRHRRIKVCVGLFVGVMMGAGVSAFIALMRRF